MFATRNARLLAKRAAVVVGGAVIAALGAPGMPLADPPQLPAELQPVRAALEKYRDPIVAVRAGYFSTVGCVQYPDGGMGVHFLNTGLIGPVPDPMAPQLLLYEPNGAGELELVAAEWLIPLATGTTGRPELFGTPFEGPMAGHEPLMPEGLHHYDLHVWLFKENPAGLFSHSNPDVNCTGPYVEHEGPPPAVPHN